MMRKLLFLSFLSIGFGVNAQTIIYQQDFEGTVDDIHVYHSSVYEDLLVDSTWCGKAGYGQAAAFSSTNVDYNSAQNATKFLALNPEAPCGGFNLANVHTDTLDLSGLTQVYIYCDYFYGSGVGWGGGIAINIENNTHSQLISTTDFNVLDQWTAMNVMLDSELLTDSVVVKLVFVGGDAGAFDNVTVSDYDITLTTGTDAELKNNNFLVYPSISSNSITVVDQSNISVDGRIGIVKDLHGQTLFALDLSSSQSEADISELAAGTYYINVFVGYDYVETLKFVKL